MNQNKESNERKAVKELVKVAKANNMQMRSQEVLSDQIIVFCQIHFQAINEQPETHPIQSQAYLNSRHGQSYSYRIKNIADRPTNLSRGHVDAPGLVVIENTTGRGRTVNPSPEERKLEDESQIVIELPRGDQIYIPKGLFFAGVLEADPSEVLMTSSNGYPVSCTVTIIPR